MLVAAFSTGTAGGSESDGEEGVAMKLDVEDAESPEPGAEQPLEDTATKRASVEMAAYQDSDHVTVFTPSIAAGVENVSGASLHGSYLIDVVSAASVDIVSTASPRWEEVRHAGSLSFDYKPQDIGVGIGGSISSEPDYLSRGANGKVLKDFDEKNWALFFAFGLTQELAGRCGAGPDGCTSFDVFSRELLRGSLSWGLNATIDPASLGSLSLDLVLESGDQSKPYRYVPMFSPGDAARVKPGTGIDWVNENRLDERPLEQLPLSRRRLALTGRYARRMGSSTLKLMERAYHDNWGLVASSTDARLVFDLGSRLQVGPRARFHLQSGVAFWKLAYVSGAGWDLPLYRTGDRELGPLWTATGGLGAKWYMGPEADRMRWALDLTVDARYTSFLDHLYILNRTALFGALGFEARF